MTGAEASLFAAVGAGATRLEVGGGEVRAL
jgi:hypothetical protein